MYICMYVEDENTLSCTIIVHPNASKLRKRATGMLNIYEKRKVHACSEELIDTWFALATRYSNQY